MRSKTKISRRTRTSPRRSSQQSAFLQARRAGDNSHWLFGLGSFLKASSRRLTDVLFCILSVACHRLPLALESGEKMPLQNFHPLIRQWFNERFAAPTEAQRFGWPAIHDRQNALVAAPTGSGKTLTAFLASLDRLLRLALAGELRDQTYVVYVSPLRALSNDIQRNLEGPLEELLALARQRHPSCREIRVAVRTGDTPPSERQRMLREPPHILVTTPESLYLVLPSRKS